MKLSHLFSRFCTLLMAIVMVGAFSFEAEAKRMGGGSSFGRQSSNVTQRQATPPAAGTPAQSATAAGAAGATGAAAAARKPWGAMLGGLAAGLGLAWLAHSLGLGPAFANFLLIALLVVVVMAVIGMVRRSRAQAPRQGGLAYQGAGAANPVTPPQYNPTKVGNDASARPWEGQAAQFDGSAAGGAGTGGSMIGSALRGSQSWGVPADFDIAGFSEAAKRNFITLQDAWDRSDIPALRAMMTDEMLAEIQSQLAERERAAPGQVNKTEVVMLEAQLLGIEELQDMYMASVEFSGMIREDPSAGPSPFREVWNMTKPKNGRGGWLVAGVQALQ
ncbi:MAG: 39S ribosomal protein L45 [Proteobacteria bacterium]|jgi:predicted lipid-binding transport protein (Tim44 family)|nr:39S ribosomal protein L45 [Pseudomonadota bacterium]